MARLYTVSPEEATGEVKEMFTGIEKKMGFVPNMFQGMANSPVTLQAYLALDRITAKGQLTKAEREVVRLAVSQFNGCRYCLSTHTIDGRQAGLRKEHMKGFRRGRAENVKLQALLDFTNRVLQTRGLVADEDIFDFLEAGYQDQHIPEIITLIAQKTLSNLFNHVHDTELDLPAAPKLNNARPQQDSFCAEVPDYRVL